MPSYRGPAGWVSTGAGTIAPRPSQANITTQTKAMLAQRTLESGESLTVDSDESFVIAGSYTVKSSEGLAVKGKMAVV